MKRMPRIDTSERLRRFFSAIRPTESEMAKAKQRAGVIRSRLERDFDTVEIKAVGSHWKETAVRRYSDYDLFAVFSRDEARKWARQSVSSSTLVGRVRRALASTYWQTALRIDKQAVTLSFAQGSHKVDVVPAVFHQFGRTSKVPMYLIPDGEGGWIETAPHLHRQYIDGAHKRSGLKLRALVRALKWWSACRTSTSISSLYLEWFAIGARVPVGYSYQVALAYLFETMLREDAPDLEDPFGISRRPLSATRTRTQRRTLRGALDQTCTRTQRALDAEARGRHEAAIDAWSLVFNRKFP